MSDMVVGGSAGDFVVFEGIVADGIAVKDIVVDDTVVESIGVEGTEPVDFGKTVT